MGSSAVAIDLADVADAVDVVDVANVAPSAAAPAGPVVATPAESAPTAKKRPPFVSGSFVARKRSPDKPRAPTTPRKDLPPTPWQVVARTLRVAHAVVVGDQLFLNSKRAIQVNLSTIGLDKIDIRKIIARAQELGIPEVDRVTTTPFISSVGHVYERAYATDRIHGRLQRIQVVSRYPRVPAKAPPLPSSDASVFASAESGIVAVAVACALAAPRAVSDVGIISVRAHSEATARAFVDLLVVAATGSEAPSTAVLGERVDDEEDDDVEYAQPDPALGSFVAAESKQMINAHPACPMFLLNVPRSQIDPAARVHEITLRRDVTLTPEHVEGSFGSHPQSYVELLARVRDAGAPLSFDRLLDYLRRTSPAT